MYMALGTVYVQYACTMVVPRYRESTVADREINTSPHCNYMGMMPLPDNLDGR